MKNLLDLSSNEIFKVLGEVFISQGFKKENLRNVWISSDVYSEEIKKYKENDIIVHFMVKVLNRELESYTVRNAITTDDLEKQAIKFLKTLPTP